MPRTKIYIYFPFPISDIRSVNIAKDCACSPYAIRVGIRSNAAVE